MTDLNNEVKCISRRHFLHGTLAILGGGAVSAILGACGPTPTPVPPTATPVAKPTTPPLPTPTPIPPKVEITYAFHDTDEPRKKMVKVFNETFPGITVNLNWIAEGFREKCLTMAAAGTLPDVIRLWEPIALDFGRANQVIDLQPYIDKQPDFNPKDLYEVFYDFALIKGKRCGLSDGWASHFAFYNKVLFDVAGVPHPKPDWSWADYVSIAKKLSKPAEKLWGSDTIPIGWLHYSYKFIWQNGGQVYNPDYTECLLDRPEAIDGLQFWADQLLKAEIMPTPAQAAGMGDLFKTGRVAIHRMGSWVMKGLVDAGLVWDVVPEPRRKERRTLIHTAFNAIATTSKNKDAAWKWLNFAVGPEGSFIYTSFLTFPASRRSVNERKPWVIKDVDAHWEYIPQAGEYGFIVPAPPKVGEVEKLQSDAFEAVYLGKKKAAEVLPEVARKVTEILRKA
ncbi:MAG: sugar ABC transporter substrate-binding protein [Chloroflexota bacterium]